MFFTFLFLVFSQSLIAADCNIKSSQLSRYDKGLRVYHLKKHESLFNTYKQGLPYLDFYRFWNKWNLKSTDPLDLIYKQKALYEDYGFSDAVASYDSYLALGQLNTIKCIDAYFMNKHLKLSKSYLSEFSIFVLQKKSQYKVYFQSSSKMSILADKRTLKQIQQRLKEGWELKYQLHNHPFMLDNSTGDVAGVILPSAPDRETYKKLYKNIGLRKASITNGFDTYSIDLNRL